MNVSKILASFLIGLSLANPSFAYPSVGSYNSEIVCLADNLYHEGKDESTRGLIALSEVVWNRVKSHRFPRSYCSVVHQKTKNLCQFSWTCRKASKNIRFRDTKDYKRLLVFSEHFIRSRNMLRVRKPKELTNGALYYHSARIRVHGIRLAKNLKFVGRFGGNHFYVPRVG